MIGPGKAPTRAAVLELKDERLVVSEAYDFLDEKRLLLAAELLRQLEDYERLLGEVKSLTARAHRALLAAVGRHGLQGLEVYPAALREGAQLDTRRRNFMGVTLLETRLGEAGAEPAVPLLPASPSSEAEACRALFAEILERSAVLAGISGNLHRLMVEYRRTERRARALENVVLPEIEQALKSMSTYLEEVDLEDAIRVRLQARD